MTDHDNDIVPSHPDDDPIEPEVIAVLTPELIARAARFTYRKYVSCCQPIHIEFSVVVEDGAYRVESPVGCEAVSREDFDRFKEYLAKFKVSLIRNNPMGRMECNDGGSEEFYVEAGDGVIFGGPIGHSAGDEAFLAFKNPLMIDRYTFLRFNRLFEVMLSDSSLERYKAWLAHQSCDDDSYIADDIYGDMIGDDKCPLDPTIDFDEIIM